MKGRVSRTLAMLLLAVLAGCASGPFHRKTAPPPALKPQPPELSQTPLYSPEMSDGNNPRVPTLPVTQPTAVVKPPEPAVQKTHKTHKPKPPATAKNGQTTPAKGSDTTTATAAPATAGGASATTPAATSGDANAATAATADKKPGETDQAANSAATAPSPIGELTAGNSQEAAQTSHQAADLIKATKDGVDGLKRDLTTDEKKKVAEIKTFLKDADLALKNGDVDGAYGLATKAKILLDELTAK
jgi:hypothetical protein